MSCFIFSVPSAVQGITVRAQFDLKMAFRSLEKEKFERTLNVQTVKLSRSPSITPRRKPARNPPNFHRQKSSSLMIPTGEPDECGIGYECGFTSQPIERVGDCDSMCTSDDFTRNFDEVDGRTLIGTHFPKSFSVSAHFSTNFLKDHNSLPITLNGAKTLDRHSIDDHLQ